MGMVTIMQVILVHSSELFIFIELNTKPRMNYLYKLPLDFAFLKKEKITSTSCY